MLEVALGADIAAAAAAAAWEAVGQSFAAVVELDIAAAAWEAGVPQIVVVETEECLGTAAGLVALERPVWGKLVASGKTSVA